MAAYNVVVTGFGPFVGHETVNASWEAVRELPLEHTLPDGRICHLHRQKVAVTYKAVDEAVEQIWSGKPDMITAFQLVIHCGVHGSTSTINLECHATNGNFCKPDWQGEHLQTMTAARKCSKDSEVACSKLSTALNVERLVDELGQSQPEAKFSRSVDVGNYLCGYIYFKSLDRNADRTLFVHVPPVNAPFSTAITSQALLHTIEKCIVQIAN